MWRIRRLSCLLVDLILVFVFILAGVIAHEARALAVVVERFVALRATGGGGWVAVEEATDE